MKILRAPKEILFKDETNSSFNFIPICFSNSVVSYFSTLPKGDMNSKQWIRFVCTNDNIINRDYQSAIIKIKSNTSFRVLILIYLNTTFLILSMLWHNMAPPVLPSTHLILLFVNLPALNLISKITLQVKPNYLRRAMYLSNSLMLATFSACWIYTQPEVECEAKWELHWCVLALVSSGRLLARFAYTFFKQHKERKGVDQGSQGFLSLAIIIPFSTNQSFDQIALFHPSQ